LCWLLFLAVPGLAQAAKQAVVETAEGEVLRGKLLGVERERITLEIDGEVVRIAMERVVGFDEVDVAPADPDAIDGGGAQDADAGGTEGPAGRDAEADAALAAPRWSALGFLPRRLGWLGDRYLWLVPEGGVQAVSLVLLCLAMLGLCVHLSTRAAGVEDRSVVRSLVVAALVMIAAGIQVACVTASPIALAAVVVGNGAMWAVASRSLFGAKVFEAFTMLLATSFLVAIGFLLLELVDYVLLTESAGLL